MPKRNKVFISYCHQDSHYLEQFQKHLVGLEKQGRLGYWVDTKIGVGDNWDEEIKAGMASAKVAVLLVSPHFLKSNYIMTTEVPAFLKAKEEEGVKVLQVILSPCMFAMFPELSKFQAINKPEQSVLSLNELERELLWVNLTTLILKHLEVPDAQTSDGITIVRGDLTKVDADAIVIPASRKMSGEYGLEKIVHQAAGHDLKVAVQRLGVCQPGEARWTPGFGLGVDGIIHAVGPRWEGGKLAERELLAGCYRQALNEAKTRHHQRVAFASIGTGAKGFPLDEAATIALREMRAAIDESSGRLRVTVVCTNDETEKAYRQALATMPPTRRHS